MTAPCWLCEGCRTVHYEAPAPFEDQGGWRPCGGKAQRPSDHYCIYPEVEHRACPVCGPGGVTQLVDALDTLIETATVWPIITVSYEGSQAWDSAFAKARAALKEAPAGGRLTPAQSTNSTEVMQE